MAERVRITEVGPRDGLQNEAGIIPTSEKVRLVDLCAASGVDEVEVTSFVSPKWVPQLGDGADVLRQMQLSSPQPMWSALVPNEMGLESLLAIHATRPQAINKVSVFTAASETFSTKNTNASIAQTIERFRPVILRAHNAGLLVRGYISCVIACPFEGPISPPQVARVAQELVDIGVDELDLGDTIGAGTPQTMLGMLGTVQSAIDPHWLNAETLARPRLTLHLHDTFNHAAACVQTALEVGVRSFDGSVAGLGGCPYASTPGKRAPGNIATETLVRTIHAAGFDTGVDLDALSRAANFARTLVANARLTVAGGQP